MANRINPTRREFVAGLLGATALSGCTLSEREVFDGGLAGGGAPKDALPTPEGGIGGTGITGADVTGLGVVGVLTDFGSLRVNGLRLETPADAEVLDAFGPIPLNRLAVGHSLTVEADVEDGALLARRIVLTQPLIGRVDAIEAGGASLRLLGVRVEAAQAARGPIAVGDRIAVSGLWRGVEVVASRLDPAPEGEPDVIAGALARPGATGLKDIGGARAALPRNWSTRAVRTRYVSAVGEWIPEGDGAGVLNAESARYGRFAADASFSDLSVEGYLEPSARAPFFEVSGLGHSFDAAAQLRPFAGRRTLFAGPYDGDFRAASAAALPESQEARRALLRSDRALAAQPVRRR
ncbi:MAG: DUF5666 domain-containing protein [Pseudomonadota bacterium]